MLKSNYNDLTGKIFGLLKVVKRIGTAKNRTPLWECLCCCGNITIVRSNHLMHNHTTSCGCYQKKKASIVASSELIGKKFGRLTVIDELNKRKNRYIIWKCLCDCGREVEVRTNSLISGHTNSCGCYHFDRIWKGGISCEPYCTEWSFKEFKNIIKERDGCICLNPVCWRVSDRLSIHHIDYNKKNCDFTNLITICASCNTRANKDRDWHKSWYRAILYKRYNYRY